MIEIAKALMTHAKVIVMDEPTAALTEREIQKLFEVIASLKKKASLSSIFRIGWKRFLQYVIESPLCGTGKP